MEMGKEQYNIAVGNNEPVIIRHGEAPRIFVYEGFTYTADSTEALIALVQKKGCPINSVIAYNQAGIKAILDSAVVDRKQDRINYGFKHSQQYDEWSGILQDGHRFGQKEFIKFLQRREPSEVNGLDYLIGNLQQFKFVINISNDYSYDDDTNYTFAVKVGEAEGTIKLPQLIVANIEVFNESGFIQEVELELEVYKPKSQDEKPTFTLTCPKLQRYLKAAVDHEIERLKKELEGYLIVAGNI